ncbi:MAG: phosphomannomutase/phosphoglucomutase [Syntrophales bacterium]
MGIFKAYDIRGVYPEELNEEIARKIGAAFIRFLGARSSVVGRDMRLSSPALAWAFIEGARAAGADVTDIGMVTTPLLYYALIDGQYESGAMVTASHLPGHMNGFKLCSEKAIPLSRDHGLPEVENLSGGRFDFRPGSFRGLYRSAQVFERYIEHISRFVHDPVPIRIVVDAGNGIAGPEVARIFEKFPVWDATTIYMEPDGNFPHHVANPLIPENTLDLQERVKKEGADIGVAFDGDADRCGFIDERGDRISEDLVTALIAQFYLLREPGAKIIYDLRSSRIVPETIAGLNGIPVRCRVGHSFIKEKMREENAVFAGELSGHYYYRDTGFTDNALFTMLQMFNFLAVKREPLSSLISPLRKYRSTGEINLEVRDIDKIYAVLKKTYADGRQDCLDGLTVSYDHWWFNLRASNTEPLIRLNLEADDSPAMEEKKREVLDRIREADPEMKVKD